MGNATSVQDIPEVIIDEFVPLVDFRDFNNLRLTSKILMVYPPHCIADPQQRLDSTLYGGDYHRFMHIEPHAMRMILSHYSQYRNMPLTMADFFEELKKQKCEVIPNMRNANFSAAISPGKSTYSPFLLVDYVSGAIPILENTNLVSLVS